jgi:hypothetical protein
MRTEIISLKFEKQGAYSNDSDQLLKDIHFNKNENYENQNNLIENSNSTVVYSNDADHYDNRNQLIENSVIKVRYSNDTDQILKDIDLNKMIIMRTETS